MTGTGPDVNRGAKIKMDRSKNTGNTCTHHTCGVNEELLPISSLSYKVKES